MVDNYHSKFFYYSKHIFLGSKKMIFNLGVVKHFGEAASRYFMYTALLHLLYSSFRVGFPGLKWVFIMGRGTAMVENHCSKTSSFHTNRPAFTRKSSFHTNRQLQ